MIPEKKKILGSYLLGTQVHSGNSGRLNLISRTNFGKKLRTQKKVKVLEILKFSTFCAKVYLSKRGFKFGKIS